MTCKDCIHYNVVTYPKGVTLPDNDIARTHGKCDSLNMWVEPTSKCENVYSTHESVGNALNALDSWESVSK